MEWVCVKRETKETQSIDKKIEDKREEIRALDIIDEVMGLDESEVIHRNELKAKLFYELRSKTNVLQQKASCKWLKDGYANTKFFHKCINKRHKRNEIFGILVNREWKEEAVEKVCSDFASNKISAEENHILTGLFLESEVKEAIDACDSNKSPWLSGFNFGFFKKFWDLLKADFMKLINGGFL
ncbi:hypothetical protein ACS0TY_010344 [Phlomoides rotata]